MTVVELRDILASLLEADLGTYRTGLGSTGPAIFIEPPRVSPGWELSGLVVTIQESPEHNSEPQTGGVVLDSLNWIVVLTQRDPKSSTASAVSKIVLRFPNSTITTVPQLQINGEGETYERAAARILDRNAERGLYV